MNSFLHSHNKHSYLSEEWHESKTLKGVRFATRCLSLGSRLDLTERLRNLLVRYEFLRSGDVLENTDANLADLLVRRLYLEWGLTEIKGLSIDGVQANAQNVIELGPELLTNEMVAVIKQSLEMSEDERKNS